MKTPPFRGNYRSTWFAEGSCEPVAEVLFNQINVDAYFLEYDDERAGDFAPLRFVPPHKRVVLGLVLSKVRERENMEGLCKHIDEGPAGNRRKRFKNGFTNHCLIGVFGQQFFGRVKTLPGLGFVAHLLHQARRDGFGG